MTKKIKDSSIKALYEKYQVLDLILYMYKKNPEQIFDAELDLEGDHLAVQRSMRIVNIDVFKQDTIQLPPDEIRAVLVKLFEEGYISIPELVRLGKTGYFNKSDYDALASYKVSFIPNELTRKYEGIKEELVIAGYNMGFRAPSDVVSKGAERKSINLANGHVAIGFKCPPGTRFSDITFKFVDDDFVDVIVNGITYRCHYKELGFYDSRKMLSNKQWVLLIWLSQLEGKIYWGHLSQPEHLKTIKQKQLLSEALKCLFGIDDEPFENPRSRNEVNLQYEIKIKLIGNMNSRYRSSIDFRNDTKALRKVSYSSDM